MCSYIFAIVYTVCIVGAGILNIVALVTPNWASEQNDNVQDVFEKIWGLFGKCLTKPGESQCAANWEEATAWQKASFVCVAASICLCALGLVWAILSIIACCCTRCLRPPLIVFAALACATITTSLILWGVYMPAKSKIGYSMICAIVSAFVLLLDTFIAVAIVKFTKDRRVHARTWSVSSRAPWLAFWELWLQKRRICKYSTSISGHLKGLHKSG